MRLDENHTITSLRLGLIGGNIAQSRAPELHRAAGKICEISVQYDLLVPNELGLSFTQTLDYAQANGFDGVNVTYPFKEVAAKLVDIPEAEVAQLGAINTILFADGSRTGWNTDFTGFMAAFAASKIPMLGNCAVIGAGGVGRAIAFALRQLGANDILVADRDQGRAQTLANDVSGRAVTMDALTGPLNGVLNCTPVGMHGHPGCPVSSTTIAKAEWVFDAVYTPKDTELMIAANKTQAHAISGVELFFWQGIHAWQHFSGQKVDANRLRSALMI